MNGVVTWDMSWADFQAYVTVVTSLGVVTAVAAGVNYNWNSHRWRRFKRICRLWKTYARKLPQSLDHPKEIDSEEDWQVLAEEILVDSWFSPFEIQTLLALALVTAKGIVASTVSVER